MPAVHRMGDANSGGGEITSIPQGTVYVNNKLVSVNGSIGTGHSGCPSSPIHCTGAWQTANGNTTVMINGVPINTEGDADTCGHTRATGSPTVNIG